MHRNFAVLIEKSNTMKANTTTFSIDSVLYDNSDTKVLIKGKTTKHHLSYSSSMYISFSELNLLINELQQKNPTTEITSLFVEEQFSSDYYQMLLHASELENNTVELSLFAMDGTKKMIRA